MRRLALRTAWCIALVALAFGVSAPVDAHWCSNIFVARARLVVKAEKTTVYVGSSPAKLRVYVQNNFPYKMSRVRMRGVASGYSITTSPDSYPYQYVHPGQTAGFTFTITRSGAPAGNLSTSTMSIQVRFRLGSWRGSSDSLVNQNPSQSSVISGAGHSQSGSLNVATLADKWPSATLPSSSPYFGDTGVKQLIKMFGHRFCWTASGYWRCGSQNCPSPCAEGSAWTGTNQWPQNCMRAGAELAKLKPKLGSDLGAARAGCANAISKGGSSMHMCLASVVGSYLYMGASNTQKSSFLSTVNSSSMPSMCKSAAARVLNSSASSLSCPSSLGHIERAACAAAEGLRNNDTYVKSYLMPNAGDGQYSTGSTSGYDSLYVAYVLTVVQAHRMATLGYVPFYPDAGNTGTTPTPDQGTPTPDTAPPPDQTVTPPPDQTVTPPPDQKITPPPDQTVTPPPDQTVTPPADQKVTPPADKGPATDAQGSSDAVKPFDQGGGGETSVGPDQGGSNNQDDNGLEGGCSVAATPGTGTGLALLLALVVGLLLRRRKER